MRFVYMDETGISNPEHEPYLVVAGVIVHADRQLGPIERHLDALVAQYIPPQHQQNFVFHAKELFNGGGKVFNRDDPAWPLEKRLEIADALANIPKKFKLPLTFGWVDRALFPETFSPEGMSARELIVGAHMTAFMRCAMSVELWMRKNAHSEVCSTIVEDNHEARRRILEAQQHHQHNDPSKFLGEEEKKYFPFRKIKEDPLFQTKRKSSPLQIADFCAYVFKKYLKDKNDQRYLRFFDPMRQQIALL